MLEHQKIILGNISSIKPLFKKELKKSIGWLRPEEMTELHRWVQCVYGFIRAYPSGYKKGKNRD